MKAVADFDAVVVGASFAGLAAAGQLRGAGRVLLVDRQPPGAGETSACGTPLAVLERLDALDALEQIHPTVAINAAGRRIRFRPAHPFATFDYRTLCDLLVSRLGDVEVVTAAFGGLDADGTLRVGDRRVRSRVLIDASGWRAVLAREHGAPPPDAAHRSVGIELRHDHGGCDLEFWVRPVELPDGLFWSFPAGAHVREGVAAYDGSGDQLRSSLQLLAHEASLPPRSVHGGVIPSRLRDPVAGPVFVVGDAAGQCLPLTAEGIRPALVWGQEAGRQAARVARGEISLDAGLATYRTEVLAHRRSYQALEHLQAALLRIPSALVPTAVRLVTRGPFAPAAQHSYWRVADPDRLEVVPGVSSTTSAIPEQCGIGKAASAPPCTRADLHGLARPERRVPSASTGSVPISLGTPVTEPAAAEEEPCIR